MASRSTIDVSAITSSSVRIDCPGAMPSQLAAAAAAAVAVFIASGVDPARAGAALEQRDDGVIDPELDVSMAHQQAVAVWEEAEAAARAELYPLGQGDAVLSLT